MRRSEWGREPRLGWSMFFLWFPPHFAPPNADACGSTPAVLVSSNQSVLEGVEWDERSAPPEAANVDSIEGAAGEVDSSRLSAPMHASRAFRVSPEFTAHANAKPIAGLKRTRQDKLTDIYTGFPTILRPVFCCCSVLHRRSVARTFIAPV